MENTPRPQKHSFSTRASIFSSPAAVKPKKFADSSVLSKTSQSYQAAQETETLGFEEEPMEVDETIVAAENDASEENPRTETTPRRKSIPTAGRRRSICVLKKDKSEDEAPAEKEQEVKVAAEQSTIFEFLETVGQNAPKMPHLRVLSEEYKSLTVYEAKLDCQIERFASIQKRYEKKLEITKDRVDVPFLTKYKNLPVVKNVPSFDELAAGRNASNPMDFVMSAMAKYRELTAESNESSKLKKELEKKQKENEILLKKKQMLEEVRKKYELSEEEKAKKRETVESIRRDAEEARRRLDNLSRPLEMICI